ncbi:hypothetical protein B9Z55_023568 [Caenorhabditis nigoni]|uniref:Uncharacterized protein n=1 Tax=Caenorhabditis nigoni TaxID=1611254 RepID=A0A2G5SR00_9PELO|nr:hypothetical protein B9Z55_023568 [Caenorhabditis nigoni]
MNGNDATPRPPGGEDNDVMRNNGGSKISAAGSEPTAQKEKPDAVIAQDASQKVQQVPLAPDDEQRRQLQQRQQADSQLILLMIQEQQIQHLRNQRALQGLPALNEPPPRVIDYSPLNHLMPEVARMTARSDELQQLVMKPRAGEEEEVKKPQTAAELQKAQSERIPQMIQKQQAEHLKNQHAQQAQQAQNEPSTECSVLSDLIEEKNRIMQNLHYPNGMNMNLIPQIPNFLNLQGPQIQNAQNAAFAQDKLKRRSQMAEYELVRRQLNLPPFLTNEVSSLNFRASEIQHSQSAVFSQDDEERRRQMAEAELVRRQSNLPPFLTNKGSSLNFRASEIQHSQNASLVQVDGKNSLHQVSTARDSKGQLLAKPTPKRTSEADESGRSCLANRGLKTMIVKVQLSTLYSCGFVFFCYASLTSSYNFKLFHIIMSPHLLRCSSHLSLRG